jgi:hypothetical protein
MAVWLDGKQVQTLEVDAPSDGFSIDVSGQTREFRLHVPAGEHWLAASVLHLYDGLPPSYGGPNPSHRPEPPPPTFEKFVKVPPNATEEQVARMRERFEKRVASEKAPANRVSIHNIDVIGPTTK